LAQLHLAFESSEDSLSVRRFVVREALSSLFEITLEATSPSEDLDLAAIVGRGASFRIARGLQRSARLWTGVCSHIEQAQVEPTGLSTYHLQIVPRLWLLTQRRNHRAFQHLSVPEIADRLLAEWRIDARWNIERAAHPKLELRTQYGESDFAFLSRLLEEAGITFYFEDHDDKLTRLVLHDRPHVGEPRAEGPVPFVDNPSQTPDREYVTRLRLAHDVQPGRFAIRDVDFRRRPDLALIAQASAGHPVEDQLEQYHYRPGAFLVEGEWRGDTPIADSGGAARHDERAGKLLAERSLEAARAARRAITFETNLVDLAPGVLFTVGKHPRADLGPDKKLLVTELSIEGAISEEWTQKGRASFTDAPYRPARRTPKPQIHSVQSAVVVGPKGEEIHTDEFGRVRVQFSWDREGRFDEHSSCWIRVSQGWAGGAYGMVALPRVGHEVLVGFLEGDPDQPVVVGRLYNNTSRVPYKLPERRTVSTWRSSSSPGLEGSNEIMFEDARGAELVYVQAERNLEKLVKVDESIAIGNNRRKAVAVDETISVGGSRAATIGNADVTDVGVRHAVAITSGAGATEVEMVDRRIAWTTGEATITLEGPNITLEAAASILLKAATDIALEADANITAKANVNLTLKSGSKLVVRSEGGDVVIQGGPIVRINPESRKALLGEDGAPLPVELPPGVDLEDEIEIAEEHSRFQRSAPAWLAEMTRPGGAWDPARHGERYGAYANFHLGVVGKAMGIPEGVLLRHAGMRRKERGDAKPEWGDPGNGVWGGTYPYGADPEDQAMVKKGIAYYGKNYA
jgi:type VI secretion system secreted protein VgrG